MKKIILGLAICVSLSLNAQTYFVAPSISVTDSKDFKSTTIPTIEVGMMGKQAGISIVTGRDNLNFDKESLSNYWIGGRLFVHHTLPVSDIYAIGLLGVGNFLTERKLYIEAGVQIVKPITNRAGVFIQYSNKDFTNYLSTGLRFNLN